jgi:hypothetical protein
MTRLAFAIGALALAFAASTPARADFAVIRFKDGACRVWALSKVGPGAKYLAAGLPTWDAAAAKGKWAVKHHRCKKWW